MKNVNFNELFGNPETTKLGDVYHHSFVNKPLEAALRGVKNAKMTIDHHGVGLEFTVSKRKLTEDNVLASELSPCPKCNGKAALSHYEAGPFKYNRWKVFCGSCGFEINNYGDLTVIDSWNHKAAKAKELTRYEKQNPCI